MQSRGPREPDPTAEDLEIAALVGSTPVPPASAAGREAARTAFLEGGRVPRAPAAVVPMPPRRRVSRRVIGSLALAASLVMMLWFGSRPTDAWRVARVEGGGAGFVDGAPIEAGASFAFGGDSSGEDYGLYLDLGERLHGCLPAGSRVRLPQGPGRVGGRSRMVSVETGDLFASSGARKLGFDLVVATENARVRVVGTTFAVRVNESGTCICLLHGDVDIEPTGAEDTLRVPRGQRLQVFADGRDPIVMPLDPAEIEILETLHSTGLAPGAPPRPTR